MNLTKTPSGHLAIPCGEFTDFSPSSEATYVMITRTPEDVQVTPGGLEDATDGDAGKPAISHTCNIEVVHAFMMNQVTDYGNTFVSPDTYKFAIQNLVKNYMETWWTQARNEDEPRKSQVTRELQAMVYQSVQEEVQDWIPREWTPLPDYTGTDAGTPATYTIHSGNVSNNNNTSSFNDSDTNGTTPRSRTS